MKNPPTWLDEFQKNFSEVLRTPLAHVQGRREARPPQSWTALGVKARSQRSAEAGVADYQRQYWFRLLTVLQKDFPVTVKLLGLWTFNQWAERFLLECPPRSHDLAELRQGFPEFLNGQDVSRMMVQASRLDAVRADIHLAPAFSEWAGFPANLPPEQLQLKAAPNWRFFQEDWSLVMLGAKARVPDAHAATQTWIVQKDAEGIAHRALHPLQARLYQLLISRPLGEAVALLEADANEIPASEKARLLQNWMAMSISWKLWAAVQMES